MSCSDHERSEEAKPELTDPVFLQHAEAHVGPWWEARIRDLMKQNRSEDAGALFREFETPEKGFDR